ncbi:hypothetical protein [Streptococcus pluranimalium]|uniref:hypothetical protein n=1 Tax=Streptococcus pluranimalium TaxID=82348 RepID=UPI003F67B06B
MMICLTKKNSVLTLFFYHPQTASVDINEIAAPLHPPLIDAAEAAMEALIKHLALAALALSTLRFSEGLKC